IRDLYSFGFMVRRPPCSTLFPYTTPSDLPVRRVDSIGGLPCAARRTRSLAGSREQADSIGQRPGTAGEANPSPGAPMRWVELIGGWLPCGSRTRSVDALAGPVGPIAGAPVRKAGPACPLVSGEPTALGQGRVDRTPVPG